MGGLTTMIHTNAHTTFYNPALLNRQEFALELTPLTIGLGRDVIDIWDFIDRNEEHFDDLERIAASDHPDSVQIITDFYRDSEAFDNRWMGAHVSPFFGFATRGWGFGIYGNLSADMKIDQGVFIPAVGARGYFDVVLGVGHGRVVTIFDRDWELGAAVRVVQRQQVEPVRVSYSEVRDATELGETIREDLEEPKTGFGIDLGMVRTLQWRGNDLDVGVTIQDFIGVLDGWVKPDLKFGAMYSLPIPVVPALKRWDLGIEYVDFFNRAGTSVFQKINLGTELGILNGFLNLRGGFHQGYPTYGLGLDLYVLKIDYAWFTRELGTAPGMLGEPTHRVQLSLGW